MKNISLFIIVFLFVLTACGAPVLPSIPAVVTITNPPLPTSIPATATQLPTPTPIPLGGGGTLIMQVNPLLVPKEFNAVGPASWLSAASDGSNLKLLDYQIWSISPDGQRALTYTNDHKVTLRNLDGSGALPLDDSLKYYINFYLPTALWLPNGNALVLAYDASKPKKVSLFILSPDGKLTKWEKPSQAMKDFAHLLLVSPDGKQLFWENSATSNGQLRKSEYYVTNLDDSDQKRILSNVLSFQDMSISPSGKYIVYLETSNQILHGCFIYKVTDGTTTLLKTEADPKGIGYCFGRGHWSPTEDKLFGLGPKGYSVLPVPDGKITTFPDINAGICYLARWTPDGKHLFLSLCTAKDSKEKIQGMGAAFDYLKYFATAGARLIDMSDGKVTEYPDAGFCNSALSPDSKWVLMYLCKGENNLMKPDYPAQMLNLETSQLVPLFKEFTSDDPKIFAQSNDGSFKGWSILWFNNPVTPASSNRATPKPEPVPPTAVPFTSSGTATPQTWVLPSIPSKASGSTNSSIKVFPQESSDVLLNPGKGWVLYYPYADKPR
ncbi:MAG: hypothetical protein WCG34_13160, partial [Leptolinea sp.]